MPPKLRPELDIAQQRELEQAALRLLAGREHSRDELARKLERRGFRREMVDVGLDRLARQGLLSESRFAESFAQSRLQRGYGPLRIRQEMRQRGLAEQLIASCLAALEADWGQRLRQVHDKKYGAGVPDDTRERARRARFLEYRGFDAEQVRQFLWRDA